MNLPALRFAGTAIIRGRIDPNGTSPLPCQSTFSTGKVTIEKPDLPMQQETITIVSVKPEDNEALSTWASQTGKAFMMLNTEIDTTFAPLVQDLCIRFLKFFYE